VSDSTRRLVVCLDTIRETGERRPLYNARILDADTLREIASSGVGAWLDEGQALEDAVVKAREARKL
jgi:hypothetical protein